MSYRNYETCTTNPEILDDLQATEALEQYLGVNAKNVMHFLPTLFWDIQVLDNHGKDGSYSCTFTFRCYAPEEDEFGEFPEMKGTLLYSNVSGIPACSVHYSMG